MSVVEHGIVSNLTNIELENIVRNSNLKFDILENQALIKDVLVELVYVVGDLADFISDRLFSLIGNNHSGVYYPVVDSVIDLLLLVYENSSSNRARKICILGILNDLFYFSLEKNTISNVGELEWAGLEKSIKDKLFSYSDEFFNEKINNL